MVSRMCSDVCIAIKALTIRSLDLNSKKAAALRCHLISGVYLSVYREAALWDTRPAYQSWQLCVSRVAVLSRSQSKKTRER